MRALPAADAAGIFCVVASLLTGNQGAAIQALCTPYSHPMNASTGTESGWQTWTRRTLTQNTCSTHLSHSSHTPHLFLLVSPRKALMP